MHYKDFFSTLSIALTFIAFVPYFRSILNGQSKPHFFSWFIWGLSTLIVSGAQYNDGGGVGTLPTILSAIVCFVIAWLAYTRRTDVSIHYTDWFFLIGALLSIPLWYLTSDPLWTVIVLTIIDTLGFGPTIRKAYHFPYEEDLLFYALYIVRNALGIVALENYSVTTVLFPLMTAWFTLLLIILMAYRRRVLDNKKAHHTKL